MRTPASAGKIRPVLRIFKVLQNNAPPQALYLWVHQILLGLGSLDEHTAALRHEMIGLLPRLRRFARGLAGNLAEADDLVQETCEKALGNVHRFQPGTSLQSWMYRILQNCWRDRLKSAHRRLVDSVPPEELAEIAGNTESEAEARLTLGAVTRAMERLDENQRIVIVLVCVE